ncbi:hypothetical protein WJX74_007035 [Apatococcus lobatus]|uniref:Transmembrane protein n=1 Tax=Apatococcus lobatus TaxID=904363 RepID=A0AAW1QWB4_9CHLO
MTFATASSLVRMPAGTEYPSCNAFRVLHVAVVALPFALGTMKARDKINLEDRIIRTNFGNQLTFEALNCGLAMASRYHSDQLLRAGTPAKRQNAEKNKDMALPGIFLAVSLITFIVNMLVLEFTSGWKMDAARLFYTCGIFVSHLISGLLLNAFWWLARFKPAYAPASSLEEMEQEMRLASSSRQDHERRLAGYGLEVLTRLRRQEGLLENALQEDEPLRAATGAERMQTADTSQDSRPGLQGSDTMREAFEEPPANFPGPSGPISFSGIRSPSSQPDFRGLNRQAALGLPAIASSVDAHPSATSGGSMPAPIHPAGGDDIGDDQHPPSPQQPSPRRHSFSMESPSRLRRNGDSAGSLSAFQAYSDQAA